MAIIIVICAVITVWFFAASLRALFLGTSASFRIFGVLLTISVLLGIITPLMTVLLILTNPPSGLQLALVIVSAICALACALYGFFCIRERPDRRVR